MSNGHKPGIELPKSKFASITPEGVVSFQVASEKIEKAIEYFGEYGSNDFDVTATVAGHAGGDGDLGETPAGPA